MKKKTTTHGDKRRNLQEAVIAICKEVFYNTRYADKAIEHYFKTEQINNNGEKEYVKSYVYFIIKNRRLIFSLSDFPEEQTLKFPALVFDLAEIIMNPAKPNTLFLKVKELEKTKLKYADLIKIRSYRYSYPEEMDAFFAEQLGDAKWEKIAQSMQLPAVTYIRTNTLKCLIDELRYQLKGDDIATEKVKGSEDALEVDHNGNLFRTDAFKNGLFEMQDASSQLVAPYLEVESGMRVVDACAGAGGKTLHIAALMKNKGRIIALDTDEKKLIQLKARASRGGVSVVEPRLIENQKTIKRLKDSADRLLLDVPCSGTGVLRRNPDAKWNFNMEQLQQITKEQEQILENYSSICKVGGKMVYSTCSILPREGDEQVKRFLNKNTNWKLLKEDYFFPDERDADGFYVSLLERVS
jgi:16S rRNA (cytosine967-C5)-methyltransferase